MDTFTIVNMINDLLMELPEDCYINLLGANGEDYDACLCHLEVDDDKSVIAIAQSCGNK